MSKSKIVCHCNAFWKCLYVSAPVGTQTKTCKQTLRFPAVETEPELQVLQVSPRFLKAYANQFCVFLLQIFNFSLTKEKVLVSSTGSTVKNIFFDVFSAFNTIQLVLLREKVQKIINTSISDNQLFYVWCIQLTARTKKLIYNTFLFFLNLPQVASCNADYT